VRRITLAASLLLAGCGQPTDDLAVAPVPAGEGAELYDRLSRTYQDRAPEALANQLEQRHEDADAVMAALAIVPGAVIADIGCGVGYFTRRLSAATGPSGTVHAVDIQPEAIAFLSQELAVSGGHDNVKTAVNAIDDVQLAPASLDLAFMAHLDFYLQPELMPENVRFLESVHAAVRPGGRLAVLQYVAPGQTIDRLSPNLQSVGFEEVSRIHDPKHDSYLVTFRRPAP